MLDLRINQQFARIGLEITDAQYKLNHKKADFHIEQDQSYLAAETVSSDLEIDYTPRLESMGFGNIWFMISDMRSKSDQSFQEGLDKMIRMGRQISEIEKNPSIGNIVFEAVAPREPEVTIAATAPIKISYTPGDINFQAQTGEVNISAELGKVSMKDFIYPSVHAFLEQEPYLKIEVVGENIDLRK